MEGESSQPHGFTEATIKNFKRHISSIKHALSEKRVSVKNKMAIKVRWKCTCSVFICIFSAFSLKIVDGINFNDRSPSKDFTEHAVIKPRIYHGRSKRELSNTLDPEEKGGHARDLDVTLVLDGVKRVLELAINHDLISGSYFEKTQRNGSYHVHKPAVEEMEFCHYRGVIRDVPDSWAALSTCNGLKGVVFDGSNTFYIDQGPRDGLSYVYDGRHVRTDKNQSCGFPQTHGITRMKREAEVIRGPYNANRQSRYVELLLVVDNEEFKELRTQQAVYTHCKDIANIINALFVPLNIFISLIGVVVWTENNEINLSSNGDTTLTNFLHYRREVLVKEHPNDNAQLLTRIKFDGGVVGKALKGPICTFEFSGGVSMDHSNVVGLVATTVAHELGHNFGMEHDNADCECPDDRCIMAPSSSATSPSHWSSCSLEYLALAFEHGMDYCLRNKPEKLFDSPVCGNGFVEPGEQCDCGLIHRCDNPCCNATSCMLFSNASCATGQCCDFQTCRPKNAGTMCRSAEHECDLPEYCTGESEYCPGDVFKIDGESCNKGKAFCYQGKCRTHSDQCQLLWGPSGKNSDTQCYDMNTKGTRHGNCGYNRLNQSYIKCFNENVYCGMVHCSHLNERLEFGMESVSILSHSFINSGGSIIACRTAIVDLGLNEVDPGLAPDGAKCGDGKMCVNQKCMSVGDLRKMSPDSCPHDCSGNGVCNSKGHCHCERGFAPPLCDYPGTGGSTDSGPAADPNKQREVATALYVIFLGIVPAIALTALLFFYSKQNVKTWWKKSPARPNNALWDNKRQSPSCGTTVLLSDSSAMNVIDIGIVRQGSPGPKANLLIENSPRATDAKPAAPELQNDLFGHFKGFSITPLKKPDDFTQISNLKSPELNHETSSSLMAPSTSVYDKIDNNLKNNSVISSASSGVKLQVHRTPNSWRNDDARLRVISPPTLPSVNFLNPKTKPKPAILEPKMSEDVVDNPALVVPTRPQISDPILEGTTAKEIISEGTTLFPIRKAPDIPVMEVPNSIAPKVPTEKYQKEPPPVPSSSTKPPRPLSSPIELQDEKKLVKELKDNREYPTLTKIANIMRNASINRSSSINERNNKVKSKVKIDREKLKNIEISNPIPQLEVEGGEKKDATIMRAQSMRETTQPKPNLHSFGSMRTVSSVKRPTSIHVPNRPTSPPPRPPNVKSPNQEYSYDDCLNLLSEKTAPLAHIDEENSPLADNIYAVIEESPKAPRKIETERKVHFSDEKYEVPKSLDLSAAEPKSKQDCLSPKTLDNNISSGSTESMGLLSEIVSEIQARNFESIYSSGTLKKKKEAKDPENYENLNSNIYNPNLSSARSDISSSSSSNGYLNPKKINAPVPLDYKNTVKPANQPKSSSILNEFNKKPSDEAPKLNNIDLSTYKPYSSSLVRNSGPLAHIYKEKTEPKPSQTVETETKPSTVPNESQNSLPCVNTNTPSSASPFVRSSFTRPSLLGTPTPPKFTPQSITSSFKTPTPEVDKTKPTDDPEISKPKPPPKSVPNLPTTGNVKRTLSSAKGTVSVHAAVSTSVPKTVNVNQKTPSLVRSAPSPPRKNSVEEKESEPQKPPKRPLPSPPRKMEVKLSPKGENPPVTRPLPAVPRKNSKENLTKVQSVKKPVIEKKPEVVNGVKSVPRKNSNVGNLQSKFEANSGANVAEKKKPIPPSAASKPVLNGIAK